MCSPSPAACRTSPALLVQSGTQAVEAITTYVTETVYGISFQVTLPTTLFQKEGPLVTAEVYAGYIQQIASEDYTYGIAYGQDVDASGNLVDMLFVTVGDPSGLFLANVDIPLATANSTGSFDKLLKMVASLTTLAAGS